MRLYISLMEGMGAMPKLQHTRPNTQSPHRAFFEIMLIMLTAWLIVWCFSLMM